MQNSERGGELWRFLTKQLRKQALTQHGVQILEEAAKRWRREGKNEYRELVAFLVFPGHIKCLLETREFALELEQIGIRHISPEIDTLIVQRAALTQLEQHHGVSNLARLVDDMLAAEAEKENAQTTRQTGS